MTNYNTLIDNLIFLKLEKIVDFLPQIIEQTNNNDLSFIDALYELTSIQVKAKKEAIYNACVKVSHFPFLKTINDFDFDFQPSISKLQIKDFASLRFMEDSSNLIFIGNPGTGKTHLATSIGIEAAKHSKSTYFITCKELVWQLEKAYEQNTLERRLKHFNSYSLLIIDELGHDILSEQQSLFLFQLLQMRYERHSTIITTNYNLSSWYRIFPNCKTGLDATLDRLLHHSKVITINGPSYRLKEVSSYLIAEE